MANILSSFLRDNFTKEGREIKTQEKESEVYNKVLQNKFGDFSGIRKSFGNVLWSDGYRRRRGHHEHEELNDIYQPRERLSFSTRNRLSVDCSILRSVIDKKTKEINRNGIEIKKLFARKCMKIYIPPCDALKHSTDQKQGLDTVACKRCPEPDMPYGQEECGEEYQSEVPRCVECGFPTKPPDVDQKRELRKLLRKRININKQSLKAVLFQQGIDIETHDNAFMISQFTYTFAEFSNKPLNKVWMQSYRGNPAYIRPIISMKGGLGSIYFTCVIHRDVFDLYDLQDIEDILKHKHPRCEREINKKVLCNLPLQKVEYVLLTYEMERQAPKYCYIEDEIQHVKKYSPSTAMGVSLIDSLYYPILQLNGQEKWIAEYYLKMRMFKGFLDVPRLGAQKASNVQMEIQGEFEKWRQDQWYVPILGSPIGSRGIQHVRLDDSPKELQYIENRDEVKKQISNTYGVSNTFMGDTSTGAGLNNDGINLVVTNRDVKHGQTVFDEQLLMPYCASYLNIPMELLEYTYSYNSSEEQDLMAEKQRDAIHIANVAQVQELGGKVFYNSDGELDHGPWKVNEPLVKGGPLAEEEEEFGGKPGEKPVNNNPDMNNDGKAKERRAQSVPHQGSPNLPKASGSGTTTKMLDTKTLDQAVTHYNKMIKGVYDTNGTKTLVHHIQLVTRANETLAEDSNAIEIKKARAYVELCDEIETSMTDEYKSPERMFHMIRENDETGISGIGLVGTGAMFADGTVVFRWDGDTPSINIYPSFEAFEEVHVNSHPTNNTKIEYLDYSVEILQKKKKFTEELHARNRQGVFSTTGGKVSSEEKEATPSKDFENPNYQGKKASQAKAGYISLSTIAKQNCGNCRFLQKSPGASIHRCAKVDGLVSKTGWSRFWKPNVKQPGEQKDIK